MDSWALSPLPEKWVPHQARPQDWPQLDMPKGFSGGPMAMLPWGPGSNLWSGILQVVRLSRKKTKKTPLKIHVININIFIETSCISFFALR